MSVCYLRVDFYAVAYMFQCLVKTPGLVGFVLHVNLLLIDDTCIVVIGVVQGIAYADGLLHIRISSSEFVMIDVKLCSGDISVSCIGELFDIFIHQFGVVSWVHRVTSHKECQLCLVFVFGQCNFDMCLFERCIAGAEAVGTQTIDIGGTNGVIGGATRLCSRLHHADNLSVGIQERGTYSIVSHR